MPLRWLQLVTRNPIVSLGEARRSAVAREKIPVRRLSPGHLEREELVSYRVDDYWLERAIDAHWIAAFRFTVQDSQVVISEIRILPAEGDTTMAPDFLLSEKGARPPGQWSAEVSGYKAVAPRGGVTARLVHRLKLGEILRSARADLDHLRREVPSLFGPGMALAPFPVEAKRATLTERRPGRKGYGLPFFAKLAKDYAERIRASDPRPAATIALARGLTPERARDLIHRARKHGLLTEAFAQGQKSGELTPKALAILKAAPRRSATKNMPKNVPGSTRQGTVSANRNPMKKKKTPR